MQDRFKRAVLDREEMVEQMEEKGCIEGKIEVNMWDLVYKETELAVDHMLNKLTGYEAGLYEIAAHPVDVTDDNNLIIEISCQVSQHLLQKFKEQLESEQESEVA